MTTNDKEMTPGEVAAIEANLFTAARWSVRERPALPWHRDRSGAITASRKESSQALAISFFLAIDRLGSRSRVVARWAEHFGLEFGGPWELCPEVSMPKDLLSELRPTQIDVMARGTGGLILFECKFTEKDGGGCSQPHPIADGEHKGMRQCNGNYEYQVNPVNKISARCALTGKGIRYWEWVPQVMKIGANTDLRECPFKGGMYQWMRNLVAARALGCSFDLPAAFILVYAEGPFPMAKRIKSPQWDVFLETVAEKAVPFRSVSYQQLIALARSAATATDQGVLSDLADWLDQRLRTVAAS
jgi:hypothetical protein